MKKATLYQKKIKKLLSGARAGKTRAFDDDPVRDLVRSVLESDAPAKQVDKAMDTLDSEFVDYNELRVAPPRDVVEAIGKDFAYIRAKTEVLHRVLNRVFDKTCSMSMDYMLKLSKRDLRRHLGEVGLPPYAAARVALRFGVHAIPVDQTLVDCLQMEEMIDPDCTIVDTQGFLERIVPQKDSLAVHYLLRSHIEASAKAIEKHRQVKAQAAAEVAAAEKAAADKAAAELAAKEEAKEARRQKAAAKAQEVKKRAAARKRAAKRKAAPAAALKPARPRRNAKK